MLMFEVSDGWAYKGPFDDSDLVYYLAGYLVCRP